jgi:Arc/MetJ-type ribon-helix-helix transcriptional regulator
MGKTEGRSITFDKELLAWIEKEVKRKRFASISHAVNYALQQLKDSESPVSSR